MLFASFFALLNSQCATVPNTKACTVAGRLAAGAICDWTISGEQSDLTLDQFIEFLEPEPTRPDPDHPGQALPARAGAVCQSAEDFEKQKVALEQACKKLAGGCSYELKQMFQTKGAEPWRQ